MELQEFTDVLDRSVNEIRFLRNSYHPAYSGVTYLQMAKSKLLDADHRGKLPDADDSFARQLFELAMLKGSVKLWQEARYIDSEITPQTSYDITLVSREGSTIDTKLVSMGDIKSEFEWKMWRHSSLVKGLYDKDSFPSFWDIMFSRDMACCNNLFQEGDLLKANSRVARVTSRAIPLGRKSGFRYLYRIE